EVEGKPTVEVHAIEAHRGSIDIRFHSRDAGCTQLSNTGQNAKDKRIVLRQQLVGRVVDAADGSVGRRRPTIDKTRIAVAPFTVGITLNPNGKWARQQLWGACETHYRAIAALSGART